MKTWTNIGGDVNWEEYGGKWAKADPGNSGRFYVLDFINMWDATGDEDCVKYICEVRLVDLSEISQDALKSAYDCCGLDIDDPEYQDDLVKVEVLHSYGCSAPMESFSANTYATRVRAEARRCADDLMADADLAELHLNTPVNAIGSTAREFGLGDIDSAMECLKAIREPTTEMGVATSLNPPTFSVRLDVKMRRVPSDDPLAYAHGFMTGCTSDDKPADDDDLAPAWLEGHALGLRVRNGDEDIRNLNHWVTPYEKTTN